MESTGKYWIPLFNVLEDFVHVVVANPKYVRAIKGQKTDDKDAMWIADLFKFDIVPSSYIPVKEIRKLRELFRYRSKLVNERSAEKCVCRIPLQFPTSLLLPFLRIPSANLPLPSLTIFSLVSLLIRSTANPFCYAVQKTRLMMLLLLLLVMKFPMTSLSK